MAQQCVAPPGTGAVDEYCEVVPTSKGDRGSGDPKPRTPLSPQTAADLNRSGADGQGLLQAVGHDPATTDVTAKGKKKRPSPAASVDAPSSNPLGAVGQALGDGSTIGTGFIIALIAIVLLMAGWSWVAFRRNAAS